MILELKSTTVFKSGTLKGLRTSTEKGGQRLNKSIEADKLEWKKDQKNLKKKKTSDKINQIILKSKFFWTGRLWNLKKVDSRVTSRHQKNDKNIIKKKEKKNK